MSNVGNGSDSQNYALIDSTSQEANFQNNQAVLDNNMVLTADSGNNTADNNTGGDTTIRTGDANISANLVNFANNNVEGGIVYGVVNVYGDLVGDIIFPEEAMQSATIANSQNGSGSINSINNSSSRTSTTSQYNDAKITNNLEIDTSTGSNETKDNTNGDNQIKTGDTNVDAQVVNIANMNVIGDMWLVIVNQAGNWIGKIVGGTINAGTYAGSNGMQFKVSEDGEITVTNQGNGSQSGNQAVINNSNSLSSTQSNTANINNNVKLSANTGNNSASRNTGGNNTIITGDANVIANIFNFVNNNVSGSGRLFVNVVNVFGSWVGDFIAPGAAKHVIASDEDANRSQTQANSMATSNNQVDKQSPSQNSSETKAIGGPGFIQPSSSQPEIIVQQEIALTQDQPSIKPEIHTKPHSPVYLPIVNHSGVIAGISQVSAKEPLHSDFIDSINTNTTNTIHINLAWLILLIPPFIFGWLIRRRYA